MDPIVDPVRNVRAKTLAAKGAVRRGANCFIVTPPSLLRSPPEYRIWRDETGRIRCSCRDHERARNAMFRCEHIQAVKFHLLAGVDQDYRSPVGLDDRREASTDDAGEYEMAQRVLKLNLVHAATSAAKVLGQPPSRSATFRLGMPEVLLELMESCGDAEAARLAANEYLRRHERLSGEAGSVAT